jgi:predicted adenylyl cyclase CyaB
VSKLIQSLKRPPETSAVSSINIIFLEEEYNDLMDGDKEIEIQVQIEDSSNLFAFLKEKAHFTGEKHQIDKYFIPTHRDFTKVRPVKEWLRLRDSSGKFSINYKSWHFEPDGKSNYCDEYETPIDSIEQLEKIFSVLDITEIVVVDKTRRTYLYQNYEFAIDSIKGLGDYVEIEYKGIVGDQKESDITSDMLSFLKTVGCGKIKRNYTGYPFQILFPDEVVFEEQ